MYGEGAYVKGTFALYEGDKLQILVGQEGSYDNYGNYGGGGGGGSFVAQGTSYGNATHLSLLVVAVAVDIIVEIM